MYSSTRPGAGIPADTFQVARQVYNIQNIYLRIGDQFDTIFAKANLQVLDPRALSNREAICRYSLVTAFQYAEFLPDSAAADASRKRLDWKYALHLSMHHNGLQSHSLCSFRQGLVASAASLHEYGQVLETLNILGLFGAPASCDLSAGTVTESVCKITRLHQLYTAMKGALAALVSAEPTWLIDNMPAHWYSRYRTGPLSQPSVVNKDNLDDEAVKLGTDISFLLAALKQHGTPHVTGLPEIKAVTRLFHEQFAVNVEQLGWRQRDCISCASHLQGDFGL